MYSNSKLNLIQQVRLIHAIYEACPDLKINKNELKKFSKLKKKFDLNLKTINLKDKNEKIDIDSLIHINHKAPTTTISRITRTLVFPKAITKYCYKLWHKDSFNKDINFLFIGLITKEREFIIKNWLSTNFEINKLFSLKFNVFTYLEKLMIFLKIKYSYVLSNGYVFIKYSNKGRFFPKKSWDEDYYKNLSRAKFVLCPSGDYIWSYRFFEAVLCGAIPIIESYCSAYEGFKFYYISDDVKNIKYKKEEVERNYKLCNDRITIKIDDLKNEINFINKNYAHKNN